jgi:hypothetical protein
VPFALERRASGSSLMPYTPPRLFSADVTINEKEREIEMPRPSEERFHHDRAEKSRRRAGHLPFHKRARYHKFPFKVLKVSLDDVKEGKRRPTTKAGERENEIVPAALFASERNSTRVYVVMLGRAMNYY